jgi:hypothetical protein
VAYIQLDELNNSTVAYIQFDELNKQGSFYQRLTTIGKSGRKAHTQPSLSGDE